MEQADKINFATNSLLDDSAFEETTVLDPDLLAAIEWRSALLAHEVLRMSSYGHTVFLPTCAY